MSTYPSLSTSENKVPSVSEILSLVSEGKLCHYDATCKKGAQFLIVGLTSSVFICSKDNYDDHKFVERSISAVQEAMESLGGTQVEGLSKELSTFRVL